MSNVIRHLLFDLDDTLYPADSGVWPAISQRISEYMRTQLGMAPAEIREARTHYARSFGTTLSGLIADYGVDPEGYLDFVHNVSAQDLIPADAALRALLDGLPQQKAVFTNASRRHAIRVLRALGVADQFETVIAIEDLELVNKPELGAYTRALRAIGQPDPTECLFVDDRSRNLIPAGRLGMTTVLVGERGELRDGIDHSIARVHDLTNAVPDLLKHGDSHGMA